MRHIRSIVLILILTSALAACGGSSGSDDELPTIMVLPTIEPTSEIPTETPTEQPTEALPEVVLTEESPDLPFLNQQPEQTEESGLPFDPSQSEEGTSGLPFPLPQIIQQPQGISGLPFLNTPQNTVVIDSETPVNIYECAETTCTVLTTLQKGDALTVLEEEEAWLNVSYEDFTGYVEAEFAIPLSEALASGDPELIPDSLSRSSSQLPPGVTTDMLATQTAQPPGGANLLPIGGSITPPPQSLPPGVNPSTAQPGFNIQDFLKTGTPTGN